jgi:hypothetical protein
LQDSPIQIGSISLHGFEIPQSLCFGGRHRLAVHSLTGGRRIVERLGPDDGKISFQGTFSGSNAEARVRAIDNLRLSGEVVWLTWESIRRQIVVESFIAEYHSPWWIQYKISCVVFHQAGASAGSTLSVAALVSTDLSNALAAVANSPISLTSLQSALSGTNALTVGTSDQQEAVSVVGTTLSSINSQIAANSAQLATPIGPNTDPEAISQLLASIVDTGGLLAAAVNARSYVSRIGINLIGSET